MVKGHLIHTRNNEQGRSNGKYNNDIRNHSSFQFTSLILGALLAGVTSVPVEVVQSQYGPGPSAVPYRPRPAPGPYNAPERSYQPQYVEKEEEEVFEPQPYKYEYGVQDDYSKAAFAKSESQNEVGAVTGSYKVRI